VKQETVACLKDQIVVIRQRWWLLLQAIVTCIRGGRTRGFPDDRLCRADGRWMALSSEQCSQWNNEWWPVLTTGHRRNRHANITRGIGCSDSKQELSRCWDGRPFGHNRHGPNSWGCSVSLSVGERAGSPSNTMWPGPRPTWHLDPSSRLATIHQRYGQTGQTGQRSRSVGRTVTCIGLAVAQNSLWSDSLCPQARHAA